MPDIRFLQLPLRFSCLAIQVYLDDIKSCAGAVFSPHPNPRHVSINLVWQTVLATVSWTRSQMLRGLIITYFKVLATAKVIYKKYVLQLTTIPIENVDFVTSCTIHFMKLSTKTSLKPSGSIISHVAQSLELIPIVINQRDVSVRVVGIKDLLRQAKYYIHSQVFCLNGAQPCRLDSIKPAQRIARDVRTQIQVLCLSFLK